MALTWRSRAEGSMQSMAATTDVDLGSTVRWLPAA
jgi:hypothetical protein